MPRIKRIRRTADRKLSVWAGVRLSPELAERLKAVTPEFGGVAPFLRYAAELELERLAPQKLPEAR